jgi:hypothetical protein
VIDLEIYVGSGAVDLFQYLNGIDRYPGKLWAQQTLDEFFGNVLRGLWDQSRHRRILLRSKDEEAPR